ncbi:MAG: hypothetical protein QRY72_01780 [Candidatus Rhabdochlamydia sp.]
MLNSNYVQLPITLAQHHLEKGKSIKATASTKTASPSREEMMQMIYALLLVVGMNMSKIQSLQSDSQIDSTVIAQAFATAMQNNTQSYLQTQKQEQEDADKESKWSLFATIAKWVCVAVGALITLATGGLASCIVFGLVLAFTLSPLFNSTVSAMSSGLEHLGLGSTAANIIAQIAVTIVLTVATCGAEGLGNGISGMIGSAAQDGANAAVDTAQVAANRVATEVADVSEQEISNEVSEAAHQEPSQKTDETSSEKESESKKSFKPKWTPSSATALTNSLAQTNLINELISQTPFGKDHPTIAALLAAAAELVICLASFGTSAPAESQTLLDMIEGQLSKLSPGKFAGALESTIEFLSNNSAGIQRGVNFVTGAGTSVTGAGTGYYLIEEGNALNTLAPLQGQSLFLQQLMTIWSKLTDQSQQKFKAEIAVNQTVLNTNFSADLQAAVIAQQSA